MGLVEGGKITLGEAGKKIGVSYRQAKRIKGALRVKGIKGILHGNTGRIPWNRIADWVRQKVLELSRELYRDFNDMHFTEKLSEDQKIELSRETVRKLRRRAEADHSVQIELWGNLAPGFFRFSRAERKATIKPRDKGFEKAIRLLKALDSFKTQLGDEAILQGPKKPFNSPFGLWGERRDGLNAQGLQRQSYLSRLLATGQLLFQAPMRIVPIK